MKRARVQALAFAPVAVFAALLLAATLLIVTPAHAQASSDPVIAQARAAGQIGEQADGYLGYVPGQQISADVRAHVEQKNLLRRNSFVTGASQNPRHPSVADFTAALTCQFFEHIAPNEHYRDESGQWRQRTAGAPVNMPSFCGNG